MENIIRSDINTELLEILELYCELLLARTGLLEAKECDAGLEEAVKSIIYAAPRTEVKELQQVRQLLMEKYGKEFALEAVENTDGKVADRVLKKLKVTPPETELVNLYLQEIARTYGVDWPRGERRRHETRRRKKKGERENHEDEDEDEDDDDDDEDGGGGGGARERQKVRGEGGRVEPPLSTEELRHATPPRELGPTRSPVSVAPPSPRVDNANPKIKLPLPHELRSMAAKMTKSKPGHLSTDENIGRDYDNDNDDNDDDGDEVERAKKTNYNNKKTKNKDRSTGPAGGAVGGKIPDVDDLAARFAALKR